MSAADTCVLLIDFCGDKPLLALLQDDVLGGVEWLPERGAAAGWLAALKRLLGSQGRTLSELRAVGVVAGPGSFTGVRTGLAAAKGLCEAARLPLATVSRLAVLSAAAGPDAVAVLHASRGQVYVRLPGCRGEPPCECVLPVDSLREAASRHPIVVSEKPLADVLAPLQPTFVMPEARHILPLVKAALEASGSDIATADAHYVQREQDIYMKAIAGQPAPALTP